MEILSTSASQTSALAERLATKLKPKDVITLQGELGAGKTFFTSQLAKFLGIAVRVQSPTYVLVREYFDAKALGDIKKIYHADLYRMESVEEIEDIGILTFTEDPEAITLIEWPELILDKLPTRTINIIFEVVDENTRRINVHNLH